MFSYTHINIHYILYTYWRTGCRTGEPYGTIFLTGNYNIIIILYYAFNILIDFEHRRLLFTDSYYSSDSDALNATGQPPPSIINVFGYINDDNNIILFLYGSSLETYISNNNNNNSNYSTR